jgi:hypothetical protein
MSIILNNNEVVGIVANEKSSNTNGRVQVINVKIYLSPTSSFLSLSFIEISNEFEIYERKATNIFITFATIASQTTTWSKEAITIKKKNQHTYFIIHLCKTSIIWNFSTSNTKIG